MRKLSFQIAVGLCFGTLLGTLSSTVFVSPVTAGPIPTLQNSFSLVTNQGFQGLSNPQTLAALKAAAQAKLAQLRAGGENSQLLARVLVSPTPSDTAKLLALLQRLGISSESSAALVAVLAGLLSETTAPVSNMQTLPVTVSDSGSGLLSKQMSSILNPRVAEYVAQNSSTVNVNASKLVDAIAIYNQIIDESSPQTLAMLAQNSDFQVLVETLRNLRAAIG